MTIRDVRVFADADDTDFYLMQCAITEDWGNSMPFRSVEKAQGPSNLMGAMDVSDITPEGDKDFPEERDARNVSNNHVEDLSSVGQRKSSLSNVNHSNTGSRNLDDENRIKGPRLKVERMKTNNATLERKGHTKEELAWTGLDVMRMNAHEIETGSKDTPEKQPLYFEVLTRASNLLSALLLAATLEGAKCFLERSSVSNRLLLRCEEVHMLEVKYSTASSLPLTSAHIGIKVKVLRESGPIASSGNA